MLTESGGRVTVDDRLRSGMDGVGDTTQRVQGRMLDFDDQAASDGLLVLQRFTDGLDGGRRNIRMGEGSQPGGGWLAVETLLENRDESLSIVNAVRIGD